MKATGIVRKVDDLGRIVIPKEIRRVMSIEKNDPVEIYTQNRNTIILRKYNPGCDECETVGVRLFGSNVRVCASCLEKMT
jgi:AbrB family transcriptional regulator, transcriptional pleiotropic regulator of transition state genes